MEEPNLTLPISKVKKIIKLDPDHVSSTEASNFALTMAAEMFVMLLANDAALVTKSNRRRKIMYSDFHKAIASNERYTFLRDIVPKRVPVGELAQSGEVEFSQQAIDQIAVSIQREGVVDLDEVPGEVPELDQEDDLPDMATEN